MKKNHQKHPLVSVILCTHNPREDYLVRTLTGLSDQTLNQDCWELVVVDNASSTPVARIIDLAWHKHARVVGEPTAGLTLARLQGIRSSSADLLVFVDDDSILATDYLENALAISKSYPFLGAWGGEINLKFETTPAEWTREHWPRLAQREVPEEIWSNFAGYPVTTPWGVGMCVRKSVALQYSDMVIKDPLRVQLDRSGGSLISGGDDDLARTSHLLGLATGLFPCLKLVHLIPPSRLCEDYLVRLTEGQSYSGVIVEWLHRERIPTATKANWVRERIGRWKRRLFMPQLQRRFLEARLRGRRHAVAKLQELNRL